MRRLNTFFLLLACAYASAQNINDVVRYSTESLQGTARYQAMSGAFGALGGDLSALNANPAGSAVFNHGLFTITGSKNRQQNDATYFSSFNATTINAFDLNQLGGVFVFKSRNDNWKKVSLAFNYDMARSFDNETYITGNSDQGIDNYFLNFAGGVPFGDLLLQDNEFLEEAYLDIGASYGYAEQQAFLGYFGGIVDPMDESDNNNTSYISNARYSTVNQRYFESTTGHNGKFTANLAGQYGDNLYLGASLNFHNVLFEKLSQLTENGFDSDSEIKNTSFDNLLRTQGNGFSFSLGAIGKVGDNLRVGGSYQSPTWYNLSDETSQKINSDLADDDISFINFNVVNVFERYTIQTPAKLTGSLAVIFGQQGLISLDYSYQDMSKAKIKPTADPSFSLENNIIAKELGGVSTLRLGGEYRLAALSLRAGYRYEQSPYADGNTVGDLNGYSAGIGYNFGGSRLDFSYSEATQDYRKTLYETGMPTPATITNKNSVFSLGYTLNF